VAGIAAGAALACAIAVPTRARADDCASAPPPVEAPEGEQAEPAATQPADAPTEPQTVVTPPVEPAPSSAAAALGRQPKRVKCLDESLVDEFGRAQVRKGVQPRDFRKRMRVAISLGGGITAGDLLDTQWLAQGNAAFWPTEDFGFDADFKLTPMTFRLERAATGFTGQNRYPDGVRRNLAYVVTGHLLWSPIHTKLRAREDRIVHGDFVFVGGAGTIIHESVQGIVFDLGISLYLYPTRWLSVRLDLLDQIIGQEAFGSRRISNDIVFSVGVGFWIPFRR
jgi:outer membrane beta-barrel protein